MRMAWLYSRQTTIGEPTLLPDNTHSLRLFITEGDKHEGKPLYEWLARKAQELGLAGATVTRAIEGFGPQHTMRTTKILDLSTNLPVIIEIIDQLDKIDNFLATVDSAVECGLATIQKVDVRFYRAHKKV